jgi:hypothetical protein
VFQQQAVQAGQQRQGQQLSAQPAEQPLSPSFSSPADMAVIIHSSPPRPSKASPQQETRDERLALDTYEAIDAAVHEDERAVVGQAPPPLDQPWSAMSAPAVMLSARAAGERAPPAQQQQQQQELLWAAQEAQAQGEGAEEAEAEPLVLAGGPSDVDAVLAAQGLVLLAAASMIPHPAKRAKGERLLLAPGPRPVALAQARLAAPTPRACAGGDGRVCRNPLPPIPWLPHARTPPCPPPLAPFPTKPPAPPPPTAPAPLLQAARTPTSSGRRTRARSAWRTGSAPGLRTASTPASTAAA